MSYIVTEEHFADYAALLYAHTGEALAAAGDVAVDAAKSASLQGYNVQAVQDSIARSEPTMTSKGQGVWVAAQDWRSLWFELGTYGRRKHPVSAATKRRRSSTSGQSRTGAGNGNPGVYPLYLLIHGLDAARAALPGLLAEAYSRITL